MKGGFAMNNIMHGMKYSFPNVPESVHHSIVSTLESLDENRQLSLSAETSRKSMKYSISFLKVAILVLIILLVVPIGGYAAHKFYQAYIVQKEGNKIEVHVSYEHIDAPIEKGDFAYKDVTFSYMPEDLYFPGNGPYEQQYISKVYSDKRGVKYVLYRLPTSGINDITDMVSTTNQWMTKNGNTVVYVERSVGWIQIWVAFSNTEYVVKIYAKGLSNEEIKKVADGVELVDSETDCSIEWEDLSEPNYSFGAKLDDVSVIPDDNILWDTGDNLLNINTKNVSINILDYHFEDSVPDDPNHPGKVYTALKNDRSGSAFDDNGNVTDHYVYLVVHVMVQNNHDSEYEYLANSLSVCFGYSANDPEHYMNELLYSSAQQSEHPVTHLHYMFEANEVYEAYYYFTVERESFEDDSKLCMLLSDEDGAWGYDKDDYIVVLNKSK